MEEAKRLLEALGEPPWTFQTFGEGEAEGRPRLARVLHGRLEGLYPVLESLSQRGAGVFFVPNRTDGRGRKAENVVEVRALFLDLDGSPLEPVLERAPSPTAVVETSPGRYHVYWRVEDIPLEVFPFAQKRLAEVFGGDPACRDLGRAMRLPGFPNRKRTPPSPARVVLLTGLRYRAEDLERALPGLLEKPPPPPPPLRASAYPSVGRREERRFRGLLEWAKAKVARAAPGQRHETLYRTTRLVAGWATALGLSPEEVAEALALAALESGLPPSEAFRTARDAAAAGARAPIPLP